MIFIGTDGRLSCFFKWIKQHLQVKHLFSKGQQEVENQIFIALITYCLLHLLKLKTAYNGQLLTIKRFVLNCLYETFTSFVQKLYCKPKKKSRGRLVIDQVKSYEETMK